MGLQALRERQKARARNRFWTPVLDKDDFRVIVFRGLAQQAQQNGEPFEVLDGWEVESGAPFRMKVYGHIRWQMQEAGAWPPEPGAILSILFTGMGETEQGRAFQFEVEEIELAELDGLTVEQRTAVVGYQRQAKAEAAPAKTDKPAQEKGGK